MECAGKREKGLCVSVVHLLRMFPRHGLRQDYNNSITEEPTCRLIFFFSLTRLQQCTAVTDIYFIIRKVQPYLLSLRVGKREESTFRNKLSNWCPEETTQTPPSPMRSLSFLRMRGSHSSGPVHSSVRPSISILGYQMVFWESGVITINYKLFTELKVISLNEEEEN